MWKKWINIFLAVWLINSITYFHSSNPLGNDNEGHSCCSTSDCLEVNSWVDCLIQEAVDDGADTPAKAHKIKSQRRYVNARSFNLSADLVHRLLYLPDAALQKLDDDSDEHYSIGVALLPAYYNFLFRLCPF
ncbi:hypothetical protein [Mucilaginibacter lacusdianchii]|uniref:hypothetical protein n=1 Tax=Mucilaginibacter lacusdianchii TaxID=2684211 RepID=UPI00131B0A4A|nr:hypothetical protein [Mucilaginibacter sp. JXJ CY 39]